MMRFPRAAIALALLGLVLLAGCEASQIREAQDSFNAGATEEARLAVRDDSQYTLRAPLAAYSPALAHYKVAYTILEKELRENRSELDKMSLLGNAMALKCLALWRISDLEPPPSDPEKAGQAAVDCANDAKAENSKYRLDPRDLRWMKALPAFVDADRGRLVVAYANKRKKFEDSYVVVRGIADEAKSAMKDEADFKIVIQLQLIQIRTLQAWVDAVFKLPQNQMQQGEYNNVSEKFEATYCALKPLFAKRKTLEIFVEQELRAASVWPLPRKGACIK
jgi:hypothetical protein